MTSGESMATVEFYEDALHTRMIGAVYLGLPRLQENVELLGRDLCRARKMDCVECVVYDEEGNAEDQFTVFRRR